MYCKVDLNGMRETQAELLCCQKELERLSQEVGAIHRSLDPRVLARENIDARLSSLQREFLDRARGTRNLANGLQRAIDAYQGCEYSLIDNASAFSAARAAHAAPAGNLARSKWE